MKWKDKMEKNEKVSKNQEETQREEMSTLFGVILFLIGTIASFAVLGFLPGKIGVLWYIILAVSVVIFCTVSIFTSFIGEGIIKKFGKNIAYSILIATVVIVLVICYVILYRGNASSKGIGITVAAILDNSIIFFYLTASMSFKDKEDIRVFYRFSIVVKIIAVVFIVCGMALFIKDDFETPGVETGTFIAIQGLMFWKVGEKYHLKTRVKKMKRRIDKVFQDFKNEKTMYGYPSLRRVGNRGKCIVYGPTADDIYVYGYYQLLRFYVEVGNDLSKLGDELKVPDDDNSIVMPDENSTVEESDNTIVMPDENSSAEDSDDTILMSDEYILSHYAKMFYNYAKDGEVQWNMEE